MKINATLPEKGRDLRLDLFRGVANWAIYLDHIPDNVVNWITTRNYGFSDAADLFVFISGYTASFVYARMMLERGFIVGATRLTKRVWQLYVAHVFLFVIYIVAIGYVALRFSDAEIINEFNLAGLAGDQAIETLRQGLLLKFKPVNLDVLPLYIVLMGLFPPVLWLMLRQPDLTMVASIVLWLLAELAICATDLAEVIGTAIGLNLLFGIPLEIGVVITALDVFLILALQRLGFRWIEAFVIALLLVIVACFAVQLAVAKPDPASIFRGFAPSVDIVRNPDMLYIALGIIGATVMPHNLYLHSAIVQTRKIGDTAEEKREAIGLASLDSTIALMFALTINASILILAATTFHQAGKTEVAEIGEAYHLIAPMLGSPLSAQLFAVALLACGLNSTVTATLAGQVVMEGFLQIRLAPWVRRLTTRLVAIVPAIAVTLWYGKSGPDKLLVLSQVVLAAQLPFAVIPLVMFTADRAKMGALVAPRWLSVLAALIALIVVALNVKLLVDAVTGRLG